ncbi:response regulator transcription factor [Bifidobacterium callitrichidarum]|uniref:DNA-binding response regulator n=1 Tax=Bifidobacterium callitrichidarum TaxID=2052941 RepID=A0A2U2NAS3_9BIFI|nr:response regulator transcription factor [Bifidobacterium callitrichidarum]PWG66212.1 DNA-binding response regulator [Bifidobacterium callitrichidarum]
MRIAIVDDDPIVCQSLQTILTATGAADVLWTANDGTTAVARYFETPANHPDILLIDIQMPGKSGLDAAGEILRKDPAARILFLTTFADRSYIAQAMALGAKGYLIKQDVTAVAPALQAVMAGQVVLGAEVLGKLTGSAAGNGNQSATGSGDIVHGAGRASGRTGIDGMTASDGDVVTASSNAAQPESPAALAADRRALDAMDERNRDIAALVAQGFDNRDIAAKLFLSEGTVRNRISAMLDKLGLTNRTQLAILWINSHR